MDAFSQLGFVPQEQADPFLSLGFVESEKPQKKMGKVMSAITGFNTGVENFTHGLMQPFLESSYVPESLKRGSQQVARQREADFREAQDANPTTANIASLIGNVGATLPLAALPGFGKSAPIRAITQGMMQGGLLGGGQYVEDNDPLQRLINTGIGTGFGAAAPLLMRGAGMKNTLVSAPSTAALGAGIGVAGADALGLDPEMGLLGGLAGFKPIGKAATNWLFPKNKILETVANSVDDVPEMLARKEAGKRLGIHVTPAEASNNALLGQFQGNLGKTEWGAKRLQQFAKERGQQEQGAITGLLDDISPTQEDAALGIRKTAQKIISGDQKALQKKAKPYYDEAYQKKIAPTQLQSLMDNDPNIENAVKEVLKDSRFAAENKGYPANSIKILDQAKKRLDAQIEKAKRDGDRHLVGVLTESKNRLLQKTDQFSPAYKEARAIYGEGAKPLEKIKESNIGRIADLPDTSLKNVSRIIFDPAQTDRKAFETLQHRISKKNPLGWQQVVRNEMERRLDKTEQTGVNFYNKILKGKREFDQFHSAVRTIPGAQQKLTDMKSIFRNLINPMTARGAAALERTGMLGRRDAVLTIKDFFVNFLDGRYDKAAIEFITNPKWDKELAEFMKKPASNILDKALKYSGILSKIQTSLATQNQQGGW